MSLGASFWRICPLPTLWQFLSILLTFQKLQISQKMIWKISHLPTLLWNLPILLCHLPTLLWWNLPILLFRLPTLLWKCFRMHQNISKLEENNICPPCSPRKSERYIYIYFCLLRNTILYAILIDSYTCKGRRVETFKSTRICFVPPVPAPHQPCQG